MNSTSLDPGSRETYWHATQAELDSIRRRGDSLTFIGVAAPLLFLWLMRGRLDELSVQIAAVVIFAVVYGCALWFVTSRKRQIAMSRGLVCSHCGYAPHDTEINEVASSRRCLRCEADL
jgi:hypothetical protein